MNICPKCHQPLEGDEEYICCAMETVQWRCTSCRKVSEGFAFPYGVCPQCGGKLEMLGDRDVEGREAMDAIRAAFEIELGGQAFYTRAASEATEPAMKELFGRLAEMEHEHMETLSKRYHAKVPVPSADFHVERAAIFAGIGNRVEDPANLFRIAIACEERAVKFFSERCEKVAQGSPEQLLYMELAAEEREHVALLTTEFDRWKQGKPGML